jgi:hypothetical protein
MRGGRAKTVGSRTLLGWPRCVFVLYRYLLVLGVLADAVTAGDVLEDIVLDFASPMGRLMGAETTLLLVSLRISVGIRSFRDGG